MVSKSYQERAIIKYFRLISIVLHIVICLRLTIRSSKSYITNKQTLYEQFLKYLIDSFFTDDLDIKYVLDVYSYLSYCVCSMVATYYQVHMHKYVSGMYRICSLFLHLNRRILNSLKVKGMCSLFPL